MWWLSNLESIAKLSQPTNWSVNGAEVFMNESKLLWMANRWDGKRKKNVIMTIRFKLGCRDNVHRGLRDVQWTGYVWDEIWISDGRKIRCHAVLWLYFRRIDESLPKFEHFVVFCQMVIGTLKPCFMKWIWTKTRITMLFYEVWWFGKIKCNLNTELNNKHI